MTGTCSRALLHTLLALAYEGSHGLAKPSALRCCSESRDSKRQLRPPMPSRPRPPGTSGGGTSSGGAPEAGGQDGTTRG
jgi:hypothetical protein